MVDHLELRLVVVVARSSLSSSEVLAPRSMAICEVVCDPEVMTHFLGEFRAVMIEN